MNINDILSNNTEEETSNIINFDEVEKTAELLEALSEEDTFLDELAKLAVFQDMVASNPKEVEKIAAIFKNKQ